MQRNGPAASVAPSGAPVYIRMLCVPQTVDTTHSKYRVAPNMLVYTDGKRYPAADHTMVAGAFTHTLKTKLVDSGCIGVSVTGVDTDDDNTAGRMFTVCVHGPCVLAGEFTAYAVGARLHSTRNDPKPIQYTSATHGQHTAVAGVSDTKDAAAEHEAQILLLNADDYEYENGALVFFCPV